MHVTASTVAYRSPPHGCPQSELDAAYREARTLRQQLALQQVVVSSPRLQAASAALESLGGYKVCRTGTPPALAMTNVDGGLCYGDLSCDVAVGAGTNERVGVEDCHDSALSQVTSGLASCVMYVHALRRLAPGSLRA